MVGNEDPWLGLWISFLKPLNFQVALVQGFLFSPHKGGKWFFKLSPQGLEKWGESAPQGPEKWGETTQNGGKVSKFLG